MNKNFHIPRRRAPGLGAPASHHFPRHENDFQSENTMTAAQFDEKLDKPGAAMHEVKIAEKEQYEQPPDNIERAQVPPFELHVVQFEAIEFMVRELGAQLKGIQTIVDDLYKSRVFVDAWVPVSSAVEYTLDYQERKYLFIWSPTAITLQSSDGPTVPIAAGWNNVSFRRGMKFTVSSPFIAPSTPIFILTRACDELLALTIFGSVNLLANPGVTLGNVGQLSDLPQGATPSNASATGTNATVTATLPAGGAGVFTWITGFEITIVGTATGGSAAGTLSGVSGGPLTYEVVQQAVANSINQVISEFSKAIRSSPSNTAISVSVPALGAGTGVVAVVVHGYTL